MFLMSLLMRHRGVAVQWCDCVLETGCLLQWLQLEYICCSGSARPCITCNDCVDFFSLVSHASCSSLPCFHWSRANHSVLILSAQGCTLPRNSDLSLGNRAENFRELHLLQVYCSKLTTLFVLCMALGDWWWTCDALSEQLTMYSIWWFPISSAV